MKNLDIRKAASNAGIHLWEIAEMYGCTDSTFSKKLRRELPPDEKNRILDIIEKLSKEVQ